MRALDPAIAHHLAERGARHAHGFVGLWGRDRTTGVIEQLGFWTGADDEDFFVDGQLRTFLGAGTILKLNPIVSEAGIKVRTTRVVFSSIPPGVREAIRGYDPRLQACTIHVGYFDPVTHQQIGTLQRVFKGKTTGVEIIRPKLGEEATITVAMRSSAMELTKTLPLKKSDEALRRRHPGDGFRKNIDVSGTVETVWGEKRAKAPAEDKSAQSSPVPVSSFEVR